MSSGVHRWPWRLSLVTQSWCVRDGLAEGLSARYPSGMSGAISSLLGALVGGLAAIGGAWLQARNTAKLQREEAARQEKQRHAESMALLQERRRLLARRYLYQLGDAVDLLRRRVDNWAHHGGLEFSEVQYPGYLEVTSLYAVARALGAERILDLEGVYVELQALSSDEAANLPRSAVDQAVKEAFGFFRYHRLALRRSKMESEIASRACTPGFRLYP
jgi:hypothetical protein